MCVSAPGRAGPRIDYHTHLVDPANPHMKAPQQNTNTITSHFVGTLTMRRAVNGWTPSCAQYPLNR